MYIYVYSYICERKGVRIYVHLSTTEGRTRTERRDIGKVPGGMERDEGVVRGGGK